ncbi:MAG TPA: hypothetical protein VNZ44_14830 [Pyrinomonadaceae bacterium]|nr:hypothetical protein [Pyrinomonadaceae bacterium]
MLLKNFTRATTRLLLAAVLLCTTLGAGAPAWGASRTECPLMNRAHSCCKTARQKRRPTSVAPARLCCVERVPQPAPANPNFAFQPSPGAADTPRPSVEQVTAAVADAPPREYAPPFKPSHSPPAYVRHAAFLI